MKGGKSKLNISKSGGVVCNYSISSSPAVCLDHFTDPRVELDFSHWFREPLEAAAVVWLLNTFQQNATQLVSMSVQQHVVVTPPDSKMAARSFQ